MTVDPQRFRTALSRFASGVCVVTTVGDDGKHAGVTISSFASLSLDPPLVLFCIGKKSAHLKAWLTGRHFCVNVLSENQERISEAFAAQNDDKFTGIAGAPGANGCFCIDGSLVALECRRTVIHDDGDHYIIVGWVDRVSLGADDRPLLRFRAAYRRIED